MTVSSTMAIGQNTAKYDGGVGDVVILCAEEEIRGVIAYWLTPMAARTVVAGDGYHAARILQDGPCHWLVTDRVLPPWPGLETFLTLRIRYPCLRIAFVDNGNLDDEILARVTGATVLLQRPLTRQAVVDALARRQPAS